jgi:hypothetical protein
MNPVLTFFKKATEQFRWRHFSWKRLLIFTSFFFIFYFGWRFFFGYPTEEIISTDFFFKKGVQAVLCGFIFSFRKPLRYEEDEN